MHVPFDDSLSDTHSDYLLINMMHEMVEDKSQNIIDRLGPAQALNAHSPIQKPPSTAASSTGQRKISLKPALPPNFSGDRSAGKVFLMSCRTYIRLCPDPFDDDEMKIVWVMLYMKTECANR